MQIGNEWSEFQKIDRRPFSNPKRSPRLTGKGSRSSGTAKVRRRGGSKQSFDNETTISNCICCL